MPYAAFGGMTAIYGRSEPYRIRLRTVTVAALGLLLSVAVGIVLAVTAAPLWATALALAGLLVVMITAANAAGASPATPTFGA